MAPSVLSARLASDVRADGPLRFDRFMERALYEPGLGYYTRDQARVGRAGDFVTSPSLSPVFGRTLARLVRLVRDAIGRPGCFRVIDAGAGEGGLIAPLLAALVADEAGSGIEAVVAERSPALRERARRAAAGSGLPVLALGKVAELAALPPR